MIEKYDLTVSEINKTVTVTIFYKKVKNVTLKVLRTLEVILSVPSKISEKWVKDFLESKKNWIDKQLIKYKKTNGYNNISTIRNGSSTQFQGKDMRIIKTQDICNKVGIDEKNIYLFLKNAEDDEKLRNLFNKWWRQEAIRIYNEEMNLLYEAIFKKHNIEKPIISVRKMKTLWGSCMKSKNKITLNEYLLKADIRCVQYVILHELTHLLYQYHNKDFYNFLTIYMPDWKERKRKLDKEVVQGL